VTEAWFPPGHPLAADVESAIPKYPFDPARAQQMLASAGWVRGGDGRLAARTESTPFQLQILGRAGTAGLEKEIQVVAQQWQALGVDATASPIPPALSANREYQATQSGVLAAFPSASDMYEVRLNSRYIANAGNRWTGQNRAGYRNPQVDQLMDSLVITIASQEQVRLQRALVQAVFTDVPFIPVTWDVYPVLIRSGVKGNPSAVNSGWNIFEWDKDA
jgi:peptide/nickel transport system substrate-binding protein